MADIQSIPDDQLLALAKPPAAPAAPSLQDMSDADLLNLAKPKAPAPAPSFFQRLANATVGMAQSIPAGIQGTTPAVKDLLGGSNYQRLGDVWQGELGPEFKADDGSFTRIDPKQHVVLNDPDTGKPTVYARSPETDTGRLTSIGHIVAPALITQPVSKIAGAVGSPGATENLVRDFAGAGVDANLPAVTQSPSVGRIAQVIRNIPFVGSPVQKGAQKAVNQAAGEAERIAGGYGEATTARQAGRSLQEGAEAFVGGDGQASGLAAEDVIKLPTRASSFSEKSGVLYDELGKHIKPGQPIALDNTAAALEGPAGRFASNPEFGKTLTDPKFNDWLGKLQKSGTLTFDELKEFRSYIGRKLAQPSIVSDIPRADLETLYGGISSDLRTAAQDAGPDALKAFDRANSYYSAGRKRINDALKDVIQADSPEGAVADVMMAANERGKSADVGKLYALRRSMPEEQWHEVAAQKIRDMGLPTAGQRNPAGAAGGAADWSPASFVTSYEKLSPEARNVLFDATGNQQLRVELDRLVRVSSALRNNEKLANHSNSANNLATLGGLGVGGAGLATDPVSTILGALALNRTGAAMMNPSFVRWVTGSAGVRAPEDWTARMVQLGQMAKARPELRPAYQALQGAHAETPEQ